MGKKSDGIASKKKRPQKTTYRWTSETREAEIVRIIGEYFDRFPEEREQRLEAILYFVGSIDSEKRSFDFHKSSYTETNGTRTAKLKKIAAAARRLHSAINSLPHGEYYNFTSALIEYDPTCWEATRYPGIRLKSAEASTSVPLTFLDGPLPPRIRAIELAAETGAEKLAGKKHVDLSETGFVTMFHQLYITYCSKNPSMTAEGHFRNYLSDVYALIYGVRKDMRRPVENWFKMRNGARKKTSISTRDNSSEK